MAGWRDLNLNGRRDPYEDPDVQIQDRVDDLLGRMTLAEKAGLMMHAIAPVVGAFPGQMSATKLIADKAMTRFNVMGTESPRWMAEWHNALQTAAAETRLGIPVTLSTDPRHGVSDNPGTATVSGAISRWPEPLGLAATRDPAISRAGSTGRSGSPCQHGLEY